MILIAALMILAALAGLSIGWRLGRASRQEEIEKAERLADIYLMSGDA